MSVVFGLADRISVLVYGEIIATDTPAADPGNARPCRKPISARCRMSAMLEVATSTPITARATSCRASTLRRRRGRDRQPARPQRRRPLDDRRRRSWATCRRTARSCFKGERDRRPASPTRSRAAASATCPRTATSSRASRCAQNLHARPEGARAKADAGRFDDMFAIFPRLRGARRRAGRRALGRRAADADDLPHADGRPRPDHDRRADRRAGAADRRARRAAC